MKAYRLDNDLDCDYGIGSSRVRVGLPVWLSQAPDVQWNNYIQASLYECMESVLSSIHGLGQRYVLTPIHVLGTNIVTVVLASENLLYGTIK